MKCHQTEQSTEGCSVGGIVISQRAFTAFLSWVCEILQDFKRPKQALINAFIICLQSQLLDFALQRYKLFFIYAKEKWLILTNSTFCVLGFLSLFYVLRFSSEWGPFGCNTRSAIRGTSSSLVFCSTEIGKVQ